MKKKVFAALLLVGALVVAPIGQSSENGIGASIGRLTGIVASATSNNSVSRTHTERYVSRLINQVTSAPSGSTVRMKDVDTLSRDFIKELSRKGDVTVVLEYTHGGVDYVVTIPAGGVIDTGVEWYGPLYLASLYGNGLNPTVNVPAGTVYVVRSGDTLSRIATANGMTMDQLMALNPQITNVNRIRVGQEINVYQN